MERRGEIRSYNGLEAWRVAVDRVVVHDVTSRLPSDERFGLTQQLRRAAVSVRSNIAQGFGRGNRQDDARYLRVARGSLHEVETQLMTAVRLGYLGEDRHRTIVDALASAGRLLAGLIRSIEK